MNLKSPSAANIVAYFFLLTLGVAFCSLGSPLPFGTVREIPQSPLWSEPVVVCELPAIMRIPSFAVDSQRVTHVVYSDKVDDSFDLFYVKIKEGKISDPENVTKNPSIKESMNICVHSGTVYVAFLDNREGGWQVYLLNVNENHVIRLTDVSSHKEDVFLSAGPDNLVVTWTDLREGVPHIYVSIVDFQGEILVDQKEIGSHSTKASTVCDTEKIHVVYLEKQVYDHIMYSQLDFHGEVLSTYDLGECIHLDPVALGLFKGPQLTVTDTVTCVWSDSRTGSHNLYYTEVTDSGDMLTNAQRITQYPVGASSWMPSIADLEGSVHIVYVNSAFGHRIFHSRIDGSYQELGTVTSSSERATAPFLLSDGKGLHCMYLRFKGESKYDLVYRNTYPFREEKISFSERIEESGITYLYSFGLSFLFAFPLTFRYNFYGIVLLVCGFLVFRSFRGREFISKFKGAEYLLLIAGIAVLSLLRGSIDYSFLAPVIYERSFIVYGWVLSCGASIIFKYLLGTRFDPQTRILLSYLVFLYLYTLVYLLPVIQYI